MKPEDRVVQPAVAQRTQGPAAPAPRGYSYAEAAQFIEFCVELDNQDDRSNDPQHRNADFWPAIDPSAWNPKPVFDSREAVVRDLLAYRANPGDASLKPWHHLYEEILQRAGAHPPKSWDFADVVADARYNGFGPYQNAWLLYEGVGANAGAYAVAIRGTVFSAEPSALQDFITQPLKARQFLSPAVRFAQSQSAAVHSGFAHGAFTLLLDERYGIVPQMAGPRIAAGSRIYLVGHSQGAALTTLVHAFLHYAAESGDDVFSLRPKRFVLKSYGFAQPKPGNQDFAADFASYTQVDDAAIVINNNIDPVPQVPLTLQSAGDVASELPNQSWLVKSLQSVASISNGLVSLAGRAFEPAVRKNAEGYGHFYQYASLRLDASLEVPAGSLNFMPAGHVYSVYGTPGDPKDIFLQHHAWTYRKLLKTQLDF
jgi:hypothetical protein